ncbi:hypothetical protein [Streptomyces finlayi]|uniref:hypothetical protein n=1 Tax=Streptomyces finlayi TaxID=67296 RepID=UPI0021566CC6|nr:hypothetical protein [Streptomyces finlayi]
MYALEENTALVVDHPGGARERLRVLGPRGVAVLDLRPGRAAHGAAWSLSGVRYSYLTDGDRYEPRHWRTLPAAGKRPLTPHTATPVAANTDVFCSAANPAGVPYAFLRTARALAATSAQRSAEATTYEDGPRFTVTFSKPPAFTAWSDDGSTPQTLIGLDVGVAAG